MVFCVILLHYYLLILQHLSCWLFFATFDHIKCITMVMVAQHVIIDTITAEIGGIRFYYLPYLP